MQIPQPNISSMWRRRSYRSCCVSCYCFSFSSYRGLLEGWFRRYFSSICVWFHTIQTIRRQVGESWKAFRFFCALSWPHDPYCHGKAPSKIFLKLWLIFIRAMPVNKNALLRYKTIDRCLRNKYRRWTLDDLVEACSDALYEMEGITRGVSVRTVQADIQMMRSDKLGYNAPIEVYDN